MDRDALVELALHARANAYAPHSSFHVGAAILTASGDVFTGCNVENASYPATCCAERVALYAAVANGHREFSAIAIASDADEATMPCGVCRQVLVEFSPDMEVICSDSEGNYEVFTADELLPLAFIL